VGESVLFVGSNPDLPDSLRLLEALNSRVVIEQANVSGL